MNVKIWFVSLCVSVLVFAIADGSVTDIKEEQMVERMHASGVNMLLLKTGLSREEYIEKVGHRNPMFQINEKLRETRPQRLKDAHWARAVSVVGILGSVLMLLLSLFRIKKRAQVS